MSVVPFGKYDSYTGTAHVHVGEFQSFDDGWGIYTDDPDTDDPTVDPDPTCSTTYNMVNGFYQVAKAAYPDHRIKYTLLPNTPEGKKQYKWEKFLKDEHGHWKENPDATGKIVEK